jgi:hypothetical protein
MNSNEIDCDFCRMKAPINYKGKDFFCVAYIIEDRYFAEMKERKRNIQIMWGNSYLLEAKRGKDDPLEGDKGSGTGVETKDKDNEPMGMDSKTSEPGNNEAGSIETEAVVGETFRG